MNARSVYFLVFQPAPQRHCTISRTEKRDEYSVYIQVMVRLEGTNMTNISAQHPLVATGGTRIAHSVFFSDTQLPVCMPELRANISATANLSKAPTEDFLTSDDLFIVELKHVRTLQPLCNVGLAQYQQTLVSCKPFCG